MGGMQVLTGGMAALAVALSLAVAGCGGGGDDGATASTPDGFRRVQTADFSLAVPTGWRSDAGKEAGGKGEFLEVRPPGADLNRPQLRVASSRGYGSALNSAVLLAEGEIPVRRPGARRVGERLVEVQGAADARRIEWTVPAGGGLAPARIGDDPRPRRRQDAGQPQRRRRGEPGRVHAGRRRRALAATGDVIKVAPARRRRRVARRGTAIGAGATVVAILLGAGRSSSGSSPTTPTLDGAIARP